MSAGKELDVQQFTESSSDTKQQQVSRLLCLHAMPCMQLACEGPPCQTIPRSMKPQWYPWFRLL